MVALLPALRMPQSRAKGAASDLHSLMQREAGLTPDGCQPPLLSKHVRAQKATPIKKKTCSKPKNAVYMNANR